MFNQSDQCVPCPTDSFCTGGLRIPCPQDTATLSQSANNPLQCLPITTINPNTNNASQEVEIDILWTTSAKLTAAQLATSTCPNLMEVVGHWLQFGMLLECHTGVANYSQTIGGVQCRAATTKTFAADYITWVSDTVQAPKQKEWMQSFLQGCLERDDLQVTEVSVRPTMLTESKAKAVSVLPNATRAHMLFPRLQYERRKWGTAHEDVATFVAATSILIMGMCCSMCMLACVLILQKKKQQQQ